MSINDYREARQAGQKEYRSRAARGQHPYLQVLDDILRFTETQGEESLGLVSIPIDHIVGTKTAGRTNAFAANFMPLLEEGSEFSSKWAALADAHLAEGIRDPIVAYEYMNRFYVQEGNKRVSVMRHFGAVSIPGTVKRILPKPQDTQESKVYAAFLDFYRLTKINYIWFSRPGRFKALLTALDKNRPWTDDDRTSFASLYTRFRKAFKAIGGDKLPGTTADALLAYLKLHSLEELGRETDASLRAGLTKSWSELAAYSIPDPVELALDPKPERSTLGKLLSPKSLTVKPEPLRALFLYERSPGTSAWTSAHDQGRLWAEQQLKGQVITSFEADISPKDALEAICRGVGQKADVIFTTSPKLLPACVKAAAVAPDAKILNCSVYSPHPSIRTYYGRMYEVKLLSGVIAGAMTRSHRVGYMADYPIYGTVAAINAFALGVSMTDPDARVFVEWRAQGDQGLWERVVSHEVDMLSGQDARSPIDPWRAYGLYQIENGVGRSVCASSWNWGRFYERIMREVLDGGWKRPGKDTTKAINYWWGLSAGVVDLQYSDDVPANTLRLARLLRESMASGQFKPFEGRTPEELLRMDTLAANVEGAVPTLDSLTDEARELVRLQGVRTEDREDEE